MNTVVIGADWGDEGKGKLVDILAEKADIVVRYHGGPNAGHTVVVRDERFAFHHIPSGALHADVINVMANGMVIDLDILVNRELADLEGKGIEPNLKISDKAELIMPWHIMLDSLEGGRIGTTKKGIGQCYADKIARKGIKIGDVVNEKNEIEKDHFYNVLKERLEEQKKLEELYGKVPFSVDGLMDCFMPLAERIKDYVTDTSSLLHNAFQKGKNVLFEGAHGTLLDIDHGTVPYVTSSNCTIASVYSGTGTRPRLDRVIGVVKAYTTRVGHGPFPTEQGHEQEIELEKGGEKLTQEDIEKAKQGLPYFVGNVMRKGGAEYGTTTGRARRCGWRDLTALKYSNRLNGYTELMITKLDVLDAFEKLRLCNAYNLNGHRITEFPTRTRDLERCEAVYECLNGWQTEISDIRKFVDLPSQAQNYIQRISNFVGVPVKLIGVGPGREQILVSCKVNVR